MRALSPAFMIPGEKIIRAEWDKSSSLGENTRRDHNKSLNVPNNYLKFFLLQYLTNIPLYQNMLQDCFMVGTAHESKNT